MDARLERALCSGLAVLGLGANVGFARLVQRRSPASFGRYRYMLLTSAWLNIAYALVHELALPFYVVVDHGVAVVQGGWVVLRPPFGQWMLALWSQLFVALQVLTVGHFYYRFVTLNRLWWHSSIWYPTTGVLGFAVIIMLSWAQFVAVDMVPSANATQVVLPRVRGAYESLRDAESWLYVQFMKCGELESECSPNAQALADGIRHMVLLVVMTSFSFGCTLSIVHRINEMPDSSVRRIQWQLLKSLLAQLSVPFLLCDVQALVLIGGTSIGLSVPAAVQLIQAGMALVSVADPVFFVLLVPSYRKAVIRIIHPRGSVSIVPPLGLSVVSTHRF